ncbi:hypothetical protein O0R52_22240 (plasmid) [Bacillus halotolerans]|uniref:Uncharacterized protein n=1 Tax=Bacillus halotolerans TaxID=260554 RepID=A0ABY7I7C8_9BACI|nr:hypothetical protein [Bacillus halotolerans]WAT23504.1 hypothetical protein O0R52_22240 [Bacillus halotolerans]
MRLEQKHIDFMNDCSGGTTVWNYEDAKIAVEILNFDPSFLHFIWDLDDMGKYDPMVRELTGRELRGAERLPYFRCVLSSDGIAYINRWESENK